MPTSLHNILKKLVKGEIRSQIKRIGEEGDRHSYRAGYQNNLGTRLGSRYSRIGLMDDLQEVIRVGQAAVDAIPEDHPDQASILNNLGVRLGDRYSRTGSMDDLQEAIRLGQAAVDATPEDHSHRAGRLNNLGLRLGDRYSRTGSMDDLQEAIRLGQAAVDATPEDHPDRADRLNNIAVRLGSRYSKTGSMNDLQEALNYLVQCLRQSNSPPLDRVKPWTLVAELISDSQDWGKGAIYFVECLDLLPKIVPKSNSNHDFQHALRNLSGLGAMTALVLLKVEKSALESLQALENCRGIISSLMIDSRSDISLLKDRRLDLWSRYSRLREAVAAPVSPASRTSSSSELLSGRN